MEREGGKPFLIKKRGKDGSQEKKRDVPAGLKKGATAGLHKAGKTVEKKSTACDGDAEKKAEENPRKKKWDWYWGGGGIEGNSNSS